MRLIDSHVHLDATAFDADRDAVVDRATAAGVEAFIVPGTERRQWPRLQALSECYPDALPAYGLHPYFIDHHSPTDIDSLADRLQRQPVVAIGECGLDFYIPNLDRTLQRDYFEAQLELARQCKLPLIIHARKAVEEVIVTIRRSGCESGVIHSFNGSLQQAHRLIDLGFLLGFGGAITYTRARRLHNLVSSLPLSAIVLETDAPDQVVAKHRGQRNEPAWLPQVLSSVCQLRPEPKSEIADTTTSNACRLFGISL